MYTLIKGDCLEEMKAIEAGSVDMILTDPPYGTMKGARRSPASKNTGMQENEWDVTLPTKEMMQLCDTVLRKNGACALFAQQPFTTDLISGAIPNMPFSYTMTWLKDHFANSLLAKKAPLNYTEDICLFFKKHHIDISNPLVEYIKMMKKFCFKGMSKRQICQKMGHQGLYHMLGVNSSQIKICTKDTYKQLISEFNFSEMDGFMDYDDLKKIMNEYDEKTPKVFNLPAGAKYKSNVLQYKKPYNGFHPTEKPVPLLVDLIETYTREGDTVLDFTMGSGSTGVACAQTGRKFIGIEMNDEYFAIAERRIREAYGK